MTFTKFHLVENSESSLTALLQQILNCDAQDAQDRIAIGSIYLDGIRVTDTGASLSPGQILRIHTQPKRYDISPILEPNRIIFENQSFVIFDKPHGIPVHATLDNQFENVHSQLERRLGYPLFVTHRLDIPTAGLLLFAKTKEFQVAFNRLLQNQKTQKVYEALTETAVPLGLHSHYMEKNQFQPKRLHDLPEPGRQLCQLQVTQCLPHSDQKFQITMNLLTGRTQQIRAQLSVLGSPVCGDTLYGSQVPPHQPRSISLIATQLSFVEADKTAWQFRRPGFVTPSAAEA